MGACYVCCLYNDEPSHVEGAAEFSELQTRGAQHITRSMASFEDIRSRNPTGMSMR